MSNVQWMLNFHHPVRQCQMTNREGACPPLALSSEMKIMLQNFPENVWFSLAISAWNLSWWYYRNGWFYSSMIYSFFFLFLTTSIPIMLVNSICEFVEINRCQRYHPARLLCSFSSPPPVHHPPLHQFILHPSLLLIPLILFLLFLPFLYLPFFLNLRILLLQLLLHPFTSFSYQMEIYVRFDYVPG